MSSKIAIRASNHTHPAGGYVDAHDDRSPLGKNKHGSYENLSTSFAGYNTGSATGSGSDIEIKSARTQTSDISYKAMQKRVKEQQDYRWQKEQEEAQKRVVKAEDLSPPTSPCQ